MNKNELKKFALKLDYNLAQAELDYYQHYILGKLFEKFNNIYFKGGTCLQKCYGIKRFSEDLDFNFIDLDIKEIISVVEKQLDSKISDLFENNFGISFSIKFKGILFDGDQRTLCKISFDFRKEGVLKKPLKKIIQPIYDDLLDYFLLALDEEEILAEKIRATLTRYKARDVFDLYELFRKGVLFDEQLVNKKLEAYGLKFNIEDFNEKLNEKKAIYDEEMKRLTKFYPNFKDCYDLIVSRIKSI